jgi:hypothetical protein
MSFKHFLERISERYIDLKELLNLFKKFFDSRKYRRLTTDKKRIINGIIKDLEKDLNVVIKYDNKGTATPKDDSMDLVTVMKKDDFDPKYKDDKILEI